MPCRWVQINSSLGDGSGVIIAKNGKTYTVLTVNHVVEKADVKYTVRTSKGKNYQATSVTRLQTAETDPDLAVVKFESPEEYPVATIADSDQAVIGTQIFVYGYPATGGLSAPNENRTLPDSYQPPGNRRKVTLAVSSRNWSGMRGGPVLIEGRVIGYTDKGIRFAQRVPAKSPRLKPDLTQQFHQYIYREAGGGGNHQSELK